MTITIEYIPYIDRSINNLPEYVDPQVKAKSEQIFNEIQERLSRFDQLDFNLIINNAHNVPDLRTRIQAYIKIADRVVQTGNCELIYFQIILLIDENIENFIDVRGSKLFNGELKTPIRKMKDYCWAILSNSSMLQGDFEASLKIARYISDQTLINEISQSVIAVQLSNSNLSMRDWHEKISQASHFVNYNINLCYQPHNAYLIVVALSEKSGFQASLNYIKSLSTPLERHYALSIFRQILEK